MEQTESLKEQLVAILKIVELLDREVRIKKLQNEQWFLNWQDELNRISVK